MGVLERVITELVCDVCKKEIDGTAKVGTLSARTQGARGRGEQREMAFHVACYEGLVATASKPGEGGATRGRPRKAAASTPSANGRRRGRPKKK